MRTLGTMWYAQTQSPFDNNMELIVTLTSRMGWLKATMQHVELIWKIDRLYQLGRNCPGVAEIDSPLALRTKYFDWDYRTGINFPVRWNICIRVINSIDGMHTSALKPEEEKDEMNAALRQRVTQTTFLWAKLCLTACNIRSIDCCAVQVIKQWCPSVSKKSARHPQPNKWG